MKYCMTHSRAMMDRASPLSMHPELEFAMPIFRAGNITANESPGVLQERNECVGSNARRCRGKVTIASPGGPP